MVTFFYEKRGRRVVRCAHPVSYARRRCRRRLVAWSEGRTRREAGAGCEASQKSPPRGARATHDGGDESETTRKGEEAALLVCFALAVLVLVCCFDEQLAGMSSLLSPAAASCFVHFRASFNT